MRGENGLGELIEDVSILHLSLTNLLTTRSL